LLPFVRISISDLSLIIKGLSVNRDYLLKIKLLNFIFLLDKILNFIYNHSNESQKEVWR